MKTIQWILIGVLLGVASLFFIKSCNSDKKIAKLSAELSNCKNAPIKIYTVTKYDTVYLTTRVKPTPKPKPNDVTGIQGSPDTKHNDITSVFYSETFKEKGIRIHWEAFTECRNDSAVLSFIDFPDIIYPKKETIAIKTLHDTIPKEVPAKIKSKFMLYGGTYVNNFKEFPGLEAGIGYLHKQNWGVMVGPMYKEKLYGSVKIFVTL